MAKTVPLGWDSQAGRPCVPNYMIPCYESQPCEGPRVCVCGSGCRPPCPVCPPFPLCNSTEPIRYANGAINLVATDLKSSGFGIPWGHTRCFANHLSNADDLGNGYNWEIRQWTYLVFLGGGSVAVLGDPNRSLLFKRILGGGLQAQYGMNVTLVLDSTHGIYKLTGLDGSVIEYKSANGAFLSFTDAAGNTVAVVSYLGNGFNFTEVQRTYSSGGTTTVESFLYTYDHPTANDPNLTGVLLRRSVNGGAWSNVEQALYTYYGSGDPNGSLNDLQTVVAQSWENGAWVSTGTTYYRYYAPGSSSSHGSSSSGATPLHLLKYVVNPAAYTRLAAAVSNPLTAPDSTVAQYADYFFAYDSTGRLVTEVVKGGTATYSFSYTNSTNAQGYNSWATKTIETLPDGYENIVYTNYAGETMLKVCQAGSEQWLDFYQYDTNGNMILHAKPSAVTGFSDSYADLLHNVSGQYQYLSNNSGLIQTYQYHAPTGYLTAELIQHGQKGTPILIRQYQYSLSAGGSSSPSAASGGGAPVYYLSEMIEYPSDGQSSSSSSSSGPLPRIITTYTCTWYPGTSQLQQRITTLPMISAAQNGSGVANTRREYFDSYGNLVWQMDEGAYITYQAFDPTTRAVTQRIEDVDTTQIAAPPGWTTPPGGGLHLITDYTEDSEGRTTQVLGPSHTIDIDGVATTIRRATWTIYHDDILQTWVGQGYATGTAPNYTFTLVNPVAITITDADGKMTDTIQATRAYTSGALQSSDNFPQSSYVRWTTQQYADGFHLSSRRVYKLIPASGTGTQGINYDETDFGYDVDFHQNRVVSGGGTITRKVFTPRYLPASIWLGTNDNGATDSDPTGGGARGNNMVMVTSNEYDNGLPGGDDNLTQTSQYVDASTMRVTNFLFDWRDRRTDIQGEMDFYQKTYFDNLDRAIQVDRYDTSLSGKLIGRTVTTFDDLRRVYQTIRYAVDPTSGIVGNGLVDNTWYEPRGMVLMQLPAGSQLFGKFTYDGLRRSQAKYIGYTESLLGYAEAQSIANDIVLEQLENTFDAASNLIQVNTRKRYHNATGHGMLTSPSGPPPFARVSYVASYPDPLGRVQAIADYGTNGGATLSRSSTIPASSPNTLVSLIVFDDAGNVQTITDPGGTATCFTYDASGRETQRVMNCAGSSSSSSSSSSSVGCPPSLDANVTIQTSYNGDGNLAQITAFNSQTGPQTTQYIYGTTLVSSGVASTLLKAYEIYPDSIGGSDQIAFTYNIQGELVSLTEQTGTVHEYSYDLLGRQIGDSVTSLGEGVDGSVLCIQTGYEVRGMVNLVTSYSSACGGPSSSSSSSSGVAIVNQVQLVYNSFAQLVTEYQSHSGPVNTATTPSVQYGYADGSANTIRPTTMTYPNGRVLNYGYGVSGGIDDAASRINYYTDSDGATQLVNYSFLGLKDIVLANSPQPGLEYTLVGIAAGNDPNTGDIYQGLDRFARVKDLIWLVTGPSSSSSSSSSSGPGTIVERIQHGYDQAGNRLWRTELADPADLHDELYHNDALYRLKELQRGSLTTGETGIVNMALAQCWSLDQTGNWSRFQEDSTGSGVWNLVQDRSSNPANEIILINNTVGSAWATPTYDAAGNMSSLPQPGFPGSPYAAIHDAWNRLISISAGVTTVATYQYDGLKRRVIKRVYSGGVLTQVRDTYFSSRWQALEERVDSSGNAERQFVWGRRYSDDILLRDRDSGGSGVLIERFYGVQDPNWNVTALVDTAGTVQERHAFAAYGVPSFLTGSFLARPSSSFDWETLFAGYRWDSDSGLFVVRHRVYAPHIGAWLERDSLGVSGGTNSYRYCADNPAALTDPSGLLAITGGVTVIGGPVVWVCEVGVVGCWAAWHAGQDIAQPIADLFYPPNLPPAPPQAPPQNPPRRRRVRGCRQRHPDWWECWPASPTDPVQAAALYLALKCPNQTQYTIDHCGESVSPIPPGNRGCPGGHREHCIVAVNGVTNPAYRISVFVCPCCRDVAGQNTDSQFVWNAHWSSTTRAQLPPCCVQ